MVEHWSRVNNCKMTFGIYLPEDCVSRQRCDAYPAIYFLNGLGRMHEEGPNILQYARACKRNKVAMIFPDTSPRGIDSTCPDADLEFEVGYNAGHNCDAT